MDKCMCCGSEDVVIVEDAQGERTFCAGCGNEVYLEKGE